MPGKTGSSSKSGLGIFAHASGDMSNGLGNNKDFDGNSGNPVEVDDFVIIPAGTLFQDVVSTVLNLLGYPKDTIQQAEGIVFNRSMAALYVTVYTCSVLHAQCL